jgi:hypothetical protein
MSIGVMKDEKLKPEAEGSTRLAKIQTTSWRPHKVFCCFL